MEQYIIPAVAAVIVAVVETLAVRAIKTIAQTAAATIGTSAVLGDVSWTMVASASMLPEVQRGQSKPRVSRVVLIVSKNSKDRHNRSTPNDTDIMGKRLCKGRSFSCMNTAWCPFLRSSFRLTV